MSQLVAAILAGGASSRMGSDKASLVHAGRTLLARVAGAVEGAGLAISVVGRLRPQDWTIDGVSFVADAHPGQGPMAAVIQALELARDASVMTLPCDLPNITTAAVRSLAEAYRSRAEAIGAVLVISGVIQPLAAVYGIGARAVLANAWAAGERSLRRTIVREDGFARIEVLGLEAEPWSDCDTPEQWQALGDGERPT